MLLSETYEAQQYGERIVAFAWQKQFRESATMLHNSYTALFCFSYDIFVMLHHKFKPHVQKSVWRKTAVQENTMGQFSFSFKAPFRGATGTLWCSWLRHCATSRKISGSIPDGVIGISH